MQQDPESQSLTPLDLDGVRTLVAWARDEGWNPGAGDADVFYATDPGGFYGFVREKTLIAGGAVVSYGGAFGFMGLFIVRPDCRGQGIGRSLWYRRRDRLLERLRPGAAIGMDGVVAMQPFYEKGGFRIAFRDMRYECLGGVFPADRQVSAILPEDFPAVAAYDLRCFGFPRPGFLDPWLRLPGNEMFKFVEDGMLKGFAVVRKAASGYKVCPLFADDDRVAEALYRACLNAVPGETLYIDVPAVNAGAVRMVVASGARQVFECARMYCGDPPDADIGKTYGITTFELG